MFTPAIKYSHRSCRFLQNYDGRLYVKDNAFTMVQDLFALITASTSTFQVGKLARLFSRKLPCEVDTELPIFANIMIIRMMLKLYLRCTIFGTRFKFGHGLQLSEDMDTLYNIFFAIMLSL